MVIWILTSLLEIFLSFVYSHNFFGSSTEVTFIPWNQEPIYRQELWRYKLLIGRWWDVAECDVISVYKDQLRMLSLMITVAELMSKWRAVCRIWLESGFLLIDSANDVTGVDTASFPSYVSSPPSSCHAITRHTAVLHGLNSSVLTYLLSYIITYLHTYLHTYLITYLHT
jgi:hypothetical protein